MNKGCVLAALAAALLLLVLLLGAGGVWYYTGTPRYAVGQIERSLRERDSERFQRHVDLDAVLGRAVDQWAKRSLGERRSGWDEFGLVLGSTLLKPQLVARLKQQLLADIEAGRRPASATVSARPVFEGLAFTRRHGATADVGLRVRDGARVYLAELRLRRHGRSWQVIEIVNLPEILERYSKDVLE